MRLCYPTLTSFVMALAVLAIGQTPAFAQKINAPAENRPVLRVMDPPTVSVHPPKFSHRIMLEVRGGANTGAPAGFTVHWMMYEKYVANGYKWYDVSDPKLYWATFVGTEGGVGGTSNYNPAKNESTFVEIGERLFDDGGVTTNWPIKMYYRTKYIFRVFAHAVPGIAQSANSGNAIGLTDPCSGQCITKTQGYWKNHFEDWPQDVLDNGLMLGNVLYTAEELLDIFNEPAAGNGLISLAHQLIAAKLNIIAFGLPQQQTEAQAIQDAIADADALIGNLVVPPVGSGFLPPSETSDLNDTLTDYNEKYDC